MNGDPFSMPDRQLESELRGWLARNRGELTEDRLDAMLARTAAASRQGQRMTPLGAVVAAAAVLTLAVVTAVAFSVLRTPDGVGAPQRLAVTTAVPGTSLTGSILVEGLRLPVGLDLGERRWQLQAIDDGRFGLTPSPESYRLVAVARLTAVYDPAVADQDGELLDAPDDLAEWLASNPRLRVVSRDRLATGAGVLDAVTVRAASLPAGNDCGGCVLIAELGASERRALSINEESTMRLAAIDMDGEAYVLIVAARTADFPAWAAEAGEVLSSLRIGGN